MGTHALLKSEILRRHRIVCMRGSEGRCTDVNLPMVAWCDPCVNNEMLAELTRLAEELADAKAEIRHFSR